MKVTYERAIEVNNELRVNVDGQHYDIKYLKDPCEISDEDEFQEITGARTPQKKTCGCDM